jgi:MtaA/CmuA family methyltransferase
MAITEKERLLDAAKRKTVDRPPCICPGGMMNMMFQEIMEQSGYRWPEAHSDPEKMAGLVNALHDAGGFENFGVPFDMTVEAEAMGATVNMGDLLCEPHVVSSPLASSAEVEKLHPMDLEHGRAKTVLDAIRILNGQNSGTPIIGTVTGAVSTAGTLVDMSVLMRECLKKPDAVKALFDYVNQQLIRYTRAMVDAGADVICIAEPSGTGEILGPAKFRKYTIAYANELLDAVEVPVKIVHICGSLHAVYDLLDEFHCDAFSVESCVPLRTVAPYLQHKALMGNIGTQALCEQPPEKISAMVHTAAVSGADIIAPACGISTLTPLANVRAMVNASRAENGGASWQK